MQGDLRKCKDAAGALKGAQVYQPPIASSGGRGRSDLRGRRREGSAIERTALNADIVQMALEVPLVGSRGKPGATDRPVGAGVVGGISPGVADRDPVHV